LVSPEAADSTARGEVSKVRLMTGMKS
jgi:hypothetical protein